jgi:hypothetical protein
MADLQATTSATDPFNLDTRWLAGWLAFSWIFVDSDDLVS